MKWNISRKKLDSFAYQSAAQKGGVQAKQSAALTMLVVFLAGLLIAACLCWMAGARLMARAAEARLTVASGIANRPASFANVKAGEGFKELASLNPFGAASPPRAEGTETQTEEFPISSLTLVGTLPEVAAWIRDSSETAIYLIGQDVRGYKLTAVEAGKAVFSMAGKDYPLYLLFSGGTTAAPAASRRPSANTAARPTPNTSRNRRFDGIIAAEEGRDGVVPRELVDALLMNPYDEMGKMRMVPADGGGVQLQSIQPDSVLAHVGVAQGDVIKAINGIEISNLGDMANAVNSLMSGARFDVMVERKGNPVDLNYQVN